MKLIDRFEICSEILEEYLPFISQLDMNVIQKFSNKIQHPWIEKIRYLPQEKLVQFDAFRESDLLKCPVWKKLIDNIQKIKKFNHIKELNINLSSYGKVKKQHELKALYSYFFNKDGNTNVIDFGGGLGNLSFFLEKELKMNPLIIEQNLELIHKGKQRASKIESNILFHHSIVDSSFSLPIKGHNDLGLGLHTCGNFSVDMIKSCVASNVKNILNFGCCYSKIQNNNYHISKHSNKNLFFNSRALANATLGFGKTTKEIYDYRIKIMKYKFSFYNYIYIHHGVAKFCAMSNSRRSLYNLSFYEFMKISLKKYYPELHLKSEEDVSDFYNSKQNIELNSYFQHYYAISRYIGEVLEIYLLCDRALFLKENGYDVKIMTFFNPKISPRNKGIVGSIAGK